MGARRQVMQVLTPAQQQTLKTNHEKMRAGREKMMHKRMHHIFSKLNLSKDQQTKITAIREDACTKAQAIRANSALSADDRHTQLRALFTATRDQIAQVLTPAQQAQLKQTMAGGSKACGHDEGFRGRHGAFRGLDLTAAQKTQLQTIRKAARDQFRALLSPDQQKQLDQLREQHTKHAGVFSGWHRG